MTSEGLGEVFKGDCADMCAGKFPLVSMGGARTPIGASGNFFTSVNFGLSRGSSMHRPPMALAEILNVKN